MRELGPAWRQAPGFASDVSAHMSRVWRGDYELTEDRLAKASQYELFAEATALDRALGTVNPRVRARAPNIAVPRPEPDVLTPRALAPVQARLRLTGRLTPPDVPGALLLKVADPARPRAHRLPLRECLTETVRVPATDWAAVEHVRIPRTSDFALEEVAQGVRIAGVPFLGHVAEMRCEQVGQQPGFRLGPLDSPEIRHRVPQILGRIDASDVQIAVLPELSASNSLLELWQEALARPDRAETSLRWIFIGTGDIGKGDPPVNRGILLDGRTGEVLMAQNKHEPYTMGPDEIAQSGLPLPSEYRMEEDIRLGCNVTIAESNFGRLTIQICEDLARHSGPVGSVVEAAGASFSFAPVFSEPTFPQGWEHRSLKYYTNEIGMTGFVSNSLATGRARGMTGALGAALVHGPWGFAEHRAVAAGDILPFLLRPDSPPQALKALQAPRGKRASEQASRVPRPVRDPSTSL